MGLFSALGNGLSGLSASSSALENISGNIANSETLGFKRAVTHFLDQRRYGSVHTRHASSRVASEVRATNSVQGEVSFSDVKTHIAIDGPGYFSVARKQSDGTFSARDLFTRRGDFTLDAQGRFVNGAGMYLQAFRVDPQTRSVVSTQPELLQISQDQLKPSATTAITYQANLPASPASAQAARDDGTHLLNVDHFRAMSWNGDTFAGGDVIASEADLFVEQSVPGGAISLFNPRGERADMQIRWAKIRDSSAEAPSQWAMFYRASTATQGEGSAWRQVDHAFLFNDDGSARNLPPSIQIDDLTVDGINVGDVSLRFADGGLTQYAANSGEVALNALAQDGHQAGEVAEIAVAEGGRVQVTYTNGLVRDVAQIALYGFKGENFLINRDGNLFEPSARSGAPIIGTQGRIVAEALEGSNVDIADELARLTLIQMVYSANARSLAAAGELMRETINVTR